MSGDGAGGGGDGDPVILAGLSERSALETDEERRGGVVAARAETNVIKAHLVVVNAAFGAIGAQPWVGAARIGELARPLGPREGVGAPSVRVAVGAKAVEGRALLVHAKSLAGQADGFCVSHGVDAPPRPPVKQGGAPRSFGGCGKA